MTTINRTPLAAGVLVCTLALAACGGGEANDDASGETGEVPTEVTELVESNLENPTSIGYDAPLSKPVPGDKSIIALQVPVDVAKVENDAMREAATALGWDFDTIVVDSTPEGPAKALDQAIDQKPDGIYYSGYDATVIGKQLDRAKSEGIAVFAEALGAESPEAVFAQIRNTPAVERLAELNAAWIVEDSEASANVLIVDTPAFPILAQYSARVEEQIGEWCSSCEVTTVDANVTDIGTALPGQLVSELQRSPDIDYIVYSFGDLSVGVNAALAAAGIQDQVKITGNLPGLENLENLKSGEEAMWLPELSPLIGWRVIDAFARQFVGDDPEVAADGSPTPSQILTPDNAEDAVYDEAGYWVGVEDYESIFEGLWDVQ